MIGLLAIAMLILAATLALVVVLNALDVRQRGALIVQLRAEVIKLTADGGQAAGERDGLIKAVSLADLSGKLDAATKRAERAEAKVEQLQREAQECLARAQQPAPVVGLTDLLRARG